MKSLLTYIDTDIFRGMAWGRISYILLADANKFYGSSMSFYRHAASADS